MGAEEIFRWPPMVGEAAAPMGGLAGSVRWPGRPRVSHFGRDRLVGQVVFRDRACSGLPRRGEKFGCPDSRLTRQMGGALAATVTLARHSQR